MKGIIRPILSAAMVACAMMMPAGAQATEERHLTANFVLQSLAAQGVTDIAAIAMERGTYSVALRSTDGRLRRLFVDSATGRTTIGTPDDSLIGNIVDSRLFRSALTAFAAKVDVSPPHAMPMHVVAQLLAGQGYGNIRGIEMVNGAYEVRAQGPDGRQARLVVDPVNGRTYPERTAAAR